MGESGGGGDLAFCEGGRERKKERETVCMFLCVYVLCMEGGGRMKEKRLCVCVCVRALCVLTAV